MNIVEIFLTKKKIDYVFLLSGESGGIGRNLDQPATLITSNLLLTTSILKLSHHNKVKKLIFLSSSCVYPKNARNPLTPELILKDSLEQSNQSFAIAKIAGMEMCKSYRKEFNNDFISVIPSTIYGPNDNFFSKNAHVIPSLISKFYIAKKNLKNSVKIWGSGKPIRDFIFYKDLADAMIFLMKKYSSDLPINIGTNESISIKKLSLLIKKLTKYRGEIEFDKTKKDGMKIKTLDCSKINKLGWKNKTSLEKGLKITYQEFFKKYKNN